MRSYLVDAIGRDELFVEAWGANRPIMNDE